MDHPGQIVTRADEERLLATAHDLLGRRLARVRYRTLEDIGLVAFPTFHDVFDSVAIELDDGRVLVMGWVMPSGEWYGTSFHIETDPPITEGQVEVDVSATAEWQPLLGQAVETVAVAWHENDAGKPDTVYSIRLGLAGGRSVVVALGEVEADDTIGVSADNLVVVFDPARALSFRPPAAFEDAYGHVIAGLG
jgi:hypothetical protein